MKHIGVPSLRLSETNLQLLHVERGELQPFDSSFLFLLPIAVFPLQMIGSYYHVARQAS